MNEAMTRLGLILLDATVKDFVLLVLAWGAALCARKSSAATRHLIWTIAASAVLALPVLSVVLPQWRVAVFPAAQQSTLAMTIPAPPAVVPTKPPPAESNVAPPMAIETAV